MFRHESDSKHNICNFQFRFHTAIKQFANTEQFLNLPDYLRRGRILKWTPMADIKLAAV